MGREDVRARLSAAKAGRPLHSNMVASQREAVRKPKPEAWRRALSKRMKAVWEQPEQHRLPAAHRWTDEEVALLGTDTDGAIAQRRGVPPHVVEGKRRRLNIPGVLDRWGAEEVALLGTRKDREVASLTGRTTAAVRRKREMLGIAPVVARWRPDEIALLGTDADRAVAERLGRTHSAVETQRRALGIPAFRPACSGGSRSGSGPAT